jgi:hypothetical protein
MKRALALLLGLATSVILVEVGLRVVARFHAPVRDLVTVGNAVEQPVFESLEAYLTSRADVVPHRDFLNYRNNALGLNDIEFAVPKPPGRFRIMVLGDSFTYGLVPYPDAVMTPPRGGPPGALHRSGPGPTGQVDKAARNDCAMFSLRVTVERDSSPDSTRPGDLFKK